MVIEHGGRLLPTKLEEIVHPQHSAVLVIDMQNDFVSQGGVFDQHGKRLTQGDAIIRNITLLLEEARKIDVQIAYLLHTNLPHHGSDSAPYVYYGLRKFNIDDPHDYPQYCIPGTWGHHIVDDLQPQDGDFLITKNRQSAFNSNLDFLLRTNGIKTAIMTGLETEGSVRTNAADLDHRGYFPVVLKDCVDSYSRDLHEAAVKLMSRYAETSDKVTEIWKHKPIEPPVL